MAISVGAQMAHGSAEPAAWRTAMVPKGGKIVMALVLIARKSTMAFVATPGIVLSRASSDMAFKPKGVAALPRPIMFEDMFITMAPMAG